MESGDDKLNAQSMKVGALSVPLAFMLCFGLYPLATVIWQLLGNSAAAPMMVGARDIAALGLGAGIQAVLSTALAVAVGLPSAYVLSLHSFRGRRLLFALVIVPFILPTVVTGHALRGLIGSAVPQGLGLVLLGHVFVNIAVVVRFVGSALESLDLRYLTQARSLGASRATSWLTIGWPLVRPAIVRAASLVFVYCFSSLGLLLVLGDRSTRTFESEVLREVSLLLDFRGAAAHTFAQMLVVGAALWLGGRSRLPSAAMSGAESPTRLPIGRGWSAFVVVVGAMYVAPFAWLLEQSIAVDGRFSVDYWVTSWTSDSSLAAIAIKSLGLAACVGVVASTVGALAAIAATDMRLRKWSRVVLAPMLFTSATMGLGMLLSYSRAPLEWDRALVPLVVAQSLLVLPIAYATIVSRMDETDDSMQVVAQSLGASASRAFFTAYGRRLISGALSAAGLCAAIACGEYGAASFLSDFQTPTLSVFLMRQLGRPGEASMAIASVIAISLSAIAMLLLGGFERLSKAAQKVRR
ncbi:MAG: hypothetical protein RL441_73 [Actinomycetota bacterium]